MARCAATRNAAAVGRCGVADHYVAADRCGALGLHTAASHVVALVAVLNAVRKFSWGDFRPVAPAVAQVAVRLVVQLAALVVALVVIPETTQASQVVRCAAAGSLLPAGRAVVSPLLPASLVAHIDPGAPDVLPAVLTKTDFRGD